MQERASSTRKAVLLAAANAFESRGFAATSINDVVRAAGVTKGALYFHFPSKESLAEAVIAEQAEWRGIQDWEKSKDGLQRLIDVSFRFADALRRDVFVRASVRLTLEYATFAADHADPYLQWIDVVRSSLDQAQESGHLIDGIDLDRFSKLLAGTVTGLQLLSEATSQRRDLPQLLETMWAALVPGLVRPEVASTLRFDSERFHAA